jgi:hypothetical protein
MMRTSALRSMALLAVLGALVTGCSSGLNAPPMATDGPNQVVLRVPGMY